MSNITTNPSANAPAAPASALANTESHFNFVFWAFHKGSLFPIQDTNQEVGRSNLACFVILIRAMLSFLNQQARLDLFHRVRGQSEDEEREVLHFLLAAAIESLPIKIDAEVAEGMISGMAAKKHGFLFYMESTAMKARFWSQLHTLTAVFESPVYFRYNEETEWLSTGIPEGVQFPQLPAEDGMLSWKSTDKPLEEHIAESFTGIFRFNGNISRMQVDRCFVAPVFLRIMVTIEAPSSVRFHHDLCRVVIQELAQRPVYYRCIAVIKLEEKETDPDLIRLFRPTGEAWYPYENKPMLPMTDDWDVDGEGKYMYVYLRVSEETHKPSCRECQTSNETNTGPFTQGLGDMAADFHKLLCPFLEEESRRT